MKFWQSVRLSTNDKAADQSKIDFIGWNEVDFKNPNLAIFEDSVKLFKINWTWADNQSDSSNKYILIRDEYSVWGWGPRSRLGFSKSGLLRLSFTHVYSINEPNDAQELL